MKQDDVVFTEVPTLEIEGVKCPHSRNLLEACISYDCFDYMRSWESFKRAERQYLRAVNRAVWDGTCARNIDGFRYSAAAIFPEKVYGELPHGRLPKRVLRFY